MTLKRLAAFLGAVALIIGAVLLRQSLDDNSSSSSDSTDTPSGSKTTVICSTELAAVCAVLGKNYSVTVEPAGRTLDRLSKDGAAYPDAWVTLDPLPGMLDTARTFANLTAATTSITAIAEDSPAIAVPADRSASLTSGCGSQSVWKCVGANAGRPWTSLDANAKGGDVLAGLMDPAIEAMGLVTFANAVAGYFGAAQLDTSSWQDSGFRSWLRTFSSNAKIVATGTTPLSTLLVRKTEVNVAASSTAEIGAVPSQRQGDVAAVAVAPAIPIVAAVATFTSRGNSVAAKAAPLLLDAGWTAAADPQPQLPAGTFVALRALWKDYNK